MRAAFSNRYTDHPSWERTNDGFLRAPARILKAGIMLYHRKEVGDALPKDFKGDTIRVLVDQDAMNDATALRTLENAQITAWDHEWVTLKNADTAGKGNVAGAARIEGPYTICDLLVTDPATIKDMESDEIPEISAAYHADLDFTPGEFEGRAYDARQCNIQYNHIAIIPYGTGRGGTDVRVLNKDVQLENKDQGGNQMALVRVKLRNTGRYVNVEEEDAKAIENEQDEAGGKVEEAKGETAEKGRSLEETMGQLEEKNGSMSQLQEEIEELKGELSVYEEKLDELLSGDGLEDAADEMNEDQDDAGEIIENIAADEKDEEKKEEVRNCRFKNVDGRKRPLRGEALYRSVLSTCGVVVENMSAEGVRGAFKAHAQIVKKFSNRGKGKTVNGVKLANSMTEGVTTRTGDTRTALQKLGYK